MIAVATMNEVSELVRRCRSQPRIGIYQSYWGRVGGGQRYVAAVAEWLSQQCKVEIVHHCPTFDRAEIEEGMEVDLSRVRFRYLPAPGRPDHNDARAIERLRRERNWAAEISAPYDVFIDSSDSIPFFCHAPKGVLLTHFPLVTFEEFHGRTTEEWRCRGILKRLAATAFHRMEWGRRFATYQRCIVNSEFTRGWMKRYWGLDAQVVFPPLRDGFRPAVKEPLVLAVGAFSNSQHKKHQVLIDAFKRLVVRGVAGWRLVLAGASGLSDDDRRYVERLRQSAAGLPIEIRTDVPGRELKDLLQRASLLWHAMGYGVDAKREPRRLEHFGMVATEAMAAGCVPVVFNGGGLPEIVTHGLDGFLWTTPAELEEQTLRLIGDERLRAQLSAAAVEASKRFNREAFERRLLAAMEPVLC